VVLVLVLAAEVSAHDKGDLMLNIEPQFGLVFPPLGISTNYRMMSGFDFGLRGTVHYYFTDFFSINSGLGYGFNYHWFFPGVYPYALAPSPGFYIIPVLGWFTAIIDLLGAMGYYGSSLVTNYFFGSYFTIPVGFRFSINAFSIGAGAMGNIPVGSSGGYSYEYVTTVNGYRSTQTKTIDFTFKPYMSWYADLGFDMSGKKDKTGGFGMFARVSGPFVNEVAVPSSPVFDPYKFRFISVSLMFQAAIQLANVPIRDKQQPEPVAEEVTEENTEE
jgi:hypothetical protein